MRLVGPSRQAGRGRSYDIDGEVCNAGRCEDRSCGWVAGGADYKMLRRFFLHFIVVHFSNEPSTGALGGGRGESIPGKRLSPLHSLLSNTLPEMLQFPCAPCAPHVNRFKSAACSFFLWRGRLTVAARRGLGGAAPLAESRHSRMTAFDPKRSFTGCGFRLALTP